MTNLVPPADIERIVGVTRHPTEHRGRAVSSEQRVYILHSGDCLRTHGDLRECLFSIALDRGIEEERWSQFEDKPVGLWVSAANGRLLPTREIS